MRAIELDENDYEDEPVLVAQWHEAPMEIFDAIDHQLEVFGLEIVMIDAGDSDHMWWIQLRSE